MSDEIVVPGDYGFGPIRVVHVTSDPVSMVVAFRRRVDGGEDGVDGLVLSPRQAAPLAHALLRVAELERRLAELDGAAEGDGGE